MEMNMANRFNPFFNPVVDLPARSRAATQPITNYPIIPEEAMEAWALRSLIFNPVVSPPPIATPAQSALPVGYKGRGLYRVTAPRGLNVRSTPDLTGFVIYTLQYNSLITVTEPWTNGWVQVSNPQQVFGYACMSCFQASGGPWLEPYQGPGGPRFEPFASTSGYPIG